MKYTKVKLFLVFNILITLFMLFLAYLMQYTDIFSVGGLKPCYLCVVVRFLLLSNIVISLVFLFFNNFIKGIFVSIAFIWVLILSTTTYQSLIPYIGGSELCEVNHVEENSELSLEKALDIINFENKAANKFGYFETASSSCVSSNKIGFYIPIVTMLFSLFYLLFICLFCCRLFKK